MDLAAVKSGLHARHSRIWRCGMALAAFLMFQASAWAFTLTLDIGWGYYNPDDTSLSTYHLQPGSIVQVIAFSEGDMPSSMTADMHFDQWSYYSGDPITGEVGPDSPVDRETYDPFTAPEGHDILLTTQIGTSEANDYGGTWFNLTGNLEVLDTYKYVYIRVFGATEFPDGEVVSSYWGVSDVYVVDPTLTHDTWYVDDVGAPQLNYFEVIPEPGSMSLIGLGGLALWYRRRRRIRLACPDDAGESQSSCTSKSRSA